jgi:hypothetical protein
MRLGASDRATHDRSRLACDGHRFVARDDHEWIVADMRQLSLGRRFEGILAWDSFFHLDHTAQRQMFAVFEIHASAGALLMFNTGQNHSEAIGEFGGDPL